MTRSPESQSIPNGFPSPRQISSFYHSAPKGSADPTLPAGECIGNH